MGINVVNQKEHHQDDETNKKISGSKNAMKKNSTKPVVEEEDTDETVSSNSSVLSVGYPFSRLVVDQAQLAQARLMAQFPRVKLAHLRTPLEYASNLSRELGVQIFIKRDDCTGLATGGNKARKLEWLMAEALEQKADYVMTQGATQSNHARQTAAAAAKLGMKCHILLEDRTGFKNSHYNDNGNVLLDDLMGASREKRATGLDMNAELEAVAETYRKERNANVYVIPGGGSNETGALGYVNCAYEMVQQFQEQGIHVDHIVHATGSSGTQAGLVVGLKALGANTEHINLLGYGVRFPKEQQEEKVWNLAQKVGRKMGLDEEMLVKPKDVVADCNYVGPGYGIPADDTIEAVRMFAELEGILLDPVYSGKGAAGLIDYCRKGKFTQHETVVFLHTGGSASLHGYIHSFKA